MGSSGSSPERRPHRSKKRASDLDRVAQTRSAAKASRKGAIINPSRPTVFPVNDKN
jgi:hypothetical protein